MTKILLTWQLFQRLAVFAFSLGILYFAYANYRDTRHFLNEAVTTQGQVLRLDQSKSLSSPVIEFLSEAGHKIEFTSEFSSSPSFFQPGERVMVHYPLGRPEAAKLGGFPLWMSGIIPAFSGLLMLLISTVTGLQYWLGDDSSTWAGSDGDVGSGSEANLD
jgi:hypothetical protein